MKKNTQSVLKIISGGQTGVDRAALDVAIFLGIPCGGYCPKGRLAEDGIIDQSYPLLETSTENYEERTEKNVQSSDVTLILTWGDLTEGTLYTYKMIQKYQKEFFVVDFLSQTSSEKFLKEVIFKDEHKVINIAGPRQSFGKFVYPQAHAFLLKVFKNKQPTYTI